MEKNLLLKFHFTTSCKKIRYLKILFIVKFSELNFVIICMVLIKKILRQQNLVNTACHQISLSKKQWQCTDKSGKLHTI